MAQLDLRRALNIISDVVINRPTPIREFDQIYMKIADMLLQAEHVSRWLDKASTIFVGDGDAIGLCLAHLKKEGILTAGPDGVHIVDFDERVVNSVTQFAKRFGLDGNISAELYNVADPLPKNLWQRFDAFYTNPPYGSNNGGKSVEVFLTRGLEAVKPRATACIVVADYPPLSWPSEIKDLVQKQLLDNRFSLVEMVPQFHHYHLDDNPELTSCSLVAKRAQGELVEYCSQPLGHDDLQNFYGREAPLTVHYIRDLRKGGALPSRDYELERLTKIP